MKQPTLLVPILFWAGSLFAQLPPTCTINNPPLAKQCNQACILCNLDGYSAATTQTVQGQQIPGYCTQIVHSMGYIGFIAGSTDLSIQVDIGTCTIGNSIEMGIYQTDDCQTFNLVGDCNTAMFTGNNYILSNTEPLVPGCAYFLVTDNNGPAACAFTVTVINGSGTAPAVGAPAAPAGPTNLCPGATVEYTIPPLFGACQYRWTAPAGALINGSPSPKILNHSEGTTVTVTWGSQGGQLCVSGSNACSQGLQVCLPVTVAPIPPTVLPPVTICAGDSYQWLDDNFYNSTQLLAFTYTTALGCDSVVRQQLTVRPPIISNLGVLRICEGACVKVGTGNYCVSGTFQEIVPAANGCDSTIFFSILTVPVAAAIPLPDTLSCQQDTIPLFSTGSTPGSTFIWQDSTGKVLSTADSVLVAAPGRYRLIVERVTQGLTCRDTATAQVFSNKNLPQLSASGDTLNCLQPLGLLHASSTTPGVNFAWSGPGGFQSNQADTTTNSPGAYLITATAPNGCLRTDTVAVVADLAPPVVTLTVSDTLTCLVDTVLLSAQSNTTGARFSWLGPQGFNTTQSDTATTLPGWYFLLATAPNGCTASDSLEVLADTLPPSLMANGDTISCAQPLAQLSAHVAPASASLQWSGPQGFNSSQSNPTTAAPGAYQVLASLENGCTATAGALVAADTAAPQVSLTGGMLSCLLPSLELTANVVPANSTLQWIGPQSFSSNLPNPTINFPGNYSLLATALNGCTAMASLTVNADTIAPQLSVLGDTLSCTQNSGAVSAVFSPANSAIAWTGPQGFSSNLPNPAVNTAGVYTATATAPNGCTATAQASVLADASIPQVDAAGDTITCLTPSITLTGQVVANGSSSIVWTGPNGFSASILSPAVSAPGTYTLTATTANGCSASATAVVEADTVKPALQLSGGTISCAQPSLNLNAVLSPANAAIQWSGPLGFSSSQANPPTSFPGNYTAVVTAANGCTATASLGVPADTLKPQVAATGGTLTCLQTSLTLGNNVSPANSALLWTGPQNFNATGSNPMVSAPGNYQIQATAPNGCSASAQTSVGIDTLPPQISANGGTLSCAQPQLALTAVSNPGNVQLLWSGPQGFSSNATSVSVVQPGNYHLVATATNGCTATTTALVAQDTVAPQLSASGGMLTCIQNSLQLGASVLPANSQLLWTGPQGFSSATLNPLVNTAGNYLLTATAPNGCTGTASATVTADSSFPTVSASGGLITCSQTTVNLGAQVNPPGTNLAWTGPQNFSSNQPNPAVSIAGTYTLTATTSAGCSATATASITADTTAPLLSTSGLTLSCALPSGTIAVTSTPAASHLTWSGPAGFSSNLANPQVQNPGQYQVTATGANGCTAVATALVAADTAAPQVSATGGLISCLQTQVQLQLALQPAGSTIAWTGPQNFSSNQPQPTISVPGDYTVLATATNGCTATTTAQVAADTSRPVLGASGGQLNCTKTNLALQANVQPGGASLQWTGPQNFSSTQLQPLVSLAGNYTLTATLANGCSASATAVVTADLSPPDLDVQGTNISCRDALAYLSANVIPAGSSLQWSGPQNFSSTLPEPVVDLPGVYTLVATGPNGCADSASLEVQALDQPTWTLSLGPDIDAEEFEPIFPSPLTELPRTDWTEVQWTFPPTVLGMPCATCQLPVIKMEASGTVQLQLTDPNGCVQTASYFIRIQQTHAIYVPNIFYPESDAGNNRFEFQIGAEARVLRVRQFRIFDRWGNLVHERPEFEANDPDHGWDGSERGKPAGPGVYVWYAEFEFANGRKKVLKGDVTLYR